MHRSIFRGALAPSVRIVMTTSALVSSTMSGVCLAQESVMALDAPLPVRTEYAAGLALAYAPTYLGASDYTTRALPVLTVRWPNGWFAGTTGFGYRFQDRGDLSTALRLGFDLGRDEDRSPALKGMGDIPLRPEIGALASYRIARGTSLWGAIRVGSGEDRHGVIADLGARMTIPLGQGHRFMSGVTASFANTASMQSQFGVDEQQASASGYRVFRPGAGLRELSASIGYGFSVTPNAHLIVQFVGRSIQGDARDSPLVKSDHKPSALILYSYRFP